MLQRISPGSSGHAGDVEPLPEGKCSRLSRQARLCSELCNPLHVFHFLVSIRAKSELHPPSDAQFFHSCIFAAVMKSRSSRRKTTQVVRYVSYWYLLDSWMFGKDQATHFEFILLSWRDAKWWSLRVVLSRLSWNFRCLRPTDSFSVVSTKAFRVIQWKVRSLLFDLAVRA